MKTQNLSTSSIQRSLVSTSYNVMRTIKRPATWAIFTVWELTLLWRAERKHLFSLFANAFRKKKAFISAKANAHYPSS